jgi:hypothetical protein
MGGILILALKNPFSVPNKPPMTITNKIAIGQGTKFWKPMTMAAVSARVEPTEISNPPAMITKVDPMAIIPTIELCLKTLSIFTHVRNLGVMNEIIIVRTKNAIMILYFPSTLKKLSS